MGPNDAVPGPQGIEQEHRLDAAMDAANRATLDHRQHPGDVRREWTARLRWEEVREVAR